MVINYNKIFQTNYLILTTFKIMLQPLSPGKRSKLDERSPKKQKDQGGRSRDVHTPPLLKQVKMKSASAVRASCILFRCCIQPYISIMNHYS